MRSDNSAMMMQELEADQKLILDFDDNRLLAALFGVHDINLARIEEQFGIAAINRGNRLVLAGNEESCGRARDALMTLYEQLKSGRDITSGDVDGALRMTQTPPTELKNTAHKNEIRTKRRTITPRSPTQARYIDALASDMLVLGTGPAGTGKTYLAVAVAAAQLAQGRIERIILSRPAVEAGENLGFLPGDMREKVDPYLRPFYDALYDMLPRAQVMRYMESGEIEIAPLAFMRGRTLANSFIILDEAQNATTVQIKMFLTRMGENSRMVITGDPSQIDLPFGAKSGLHDALEILPNIEGVSIINFTEQDVLRHNIVTRIVKAYRQREMNMTHDLAKTDKPTRVNQSEAQNRKGKGRKGKDKT